MQGYKCGVQVEGQRRSGSRGREGGRMKERARVSRSYSRGDGGRLPAAEAGALLGRGGRPLPTSDSRLLCALPA
jgi:hypothetical protein